MCGISEYVARYSPCMLPLIDVYMQVIILCIRCTMYSRNIQSSITYSCSGQFPESLHDTCHRHCMSAVGFVAVTAVIAKELSWN
jgi:hypothetical protein